MQMDNKEEKSSMLEMAVKHLVPGMVLAQDVVSDDGKVLVNNAVVISQHTINKLQDWQIDAVMIVEEKVRKPFEDPEIQKFVNTYNQSIDVVNRAFDQVRLTQKVPVGTFVEVSQEIQKNTPTSGNVIDQLYNLPSCDDYTFHHCVNVSVISALLAGWLGYPEKVISDLSLAGLLHDIGKSQLPQHLLHRPDRLPSEEYEQYKKHVKLGYDLLQNSPDLPQSVKMSILAHHERRDGSGYPYKLRGDKIHPYARLVAVADLYDEGLTINRAPDIVYSPYAALENLKSQVSGLDAKPVITFIDRMSNFLSGNMVAITDGRIGRVVFINKECPCRPMILLEDGQVLDLSVCPELEVLYLA